MFEDFGHVMSYDVMCFVCFVRSCLSMFVSDSGQWNPVNLKKMSFGILPCLANNQFSFDYSNPKIDNTVENQGGPTPSTRRVLIISPF